MDEMEDLYEDMADLNADMEEMQEVLGRNYAGEFDEADLMDELDELDAEVGAEQMGSGSTNMNYVPG